jgi:hypothetical protein
MVRRDRQRRHIVVRFPGAASVASLYALISVKFAVFCATAEHAAEVVALRKLIVSAPDAEAADFAAARSPALGRTCRG